MGQNKVTIEQYIGFEKKKAMGNNKKVNVGKVVAFVFLAIFSIIWMMPLVILLFGSLRGQNSILSRPDLLFNPPYGYTFDNYKILLKGEWPDYIMAGGNNITQNVHYSTWFLNSCLSAIGGTLLYLFVASIAAYAFVFLDFKYRNVIFAILIGSMVIPGVATTVGNLQTLYSTGLTKVSVLALIVTSLSGVYGMYLIKTFFEGIPKDLIESAKMDGYSNFKTYYKIVLPLGKTALFVQGLFGFMGGWNDLVWPQTLYAGSNNAMRWTLQVGMAYVVNNFKGADMIGLSLAGGVVCLLPVLVVYLIAQNKIIEGMAGAGIKR